MLVTMLTIGYGDVTLQSVPEIIIVMFCMIVGIIFFGILLGTIADALKVSSFPLDVSSQYEVHCAGHLYQCKGCNNFGWPPPLTYGDAWLQKTFHCMHCLCLQFAAVGHGQEFKEDGKNKVHARADAPMRCSWTPLCLQWMYPIIANS